MNSTSNVRERKYRPGTRAPRNSTLCRVVRDGGLVAAIAGLWFGFAPGARGLRAQGTELVAEFAATSANVSVPGSEVKIEILRWSTDEERLALVESMEPLPPPLPPEEGEEGGRGGRGGRGGGRGGRGGAPEEPPDPISRLTEAISEQPTVGYIWTGEVAGYSVKYAYRIDGPDGGDRIILATNRRLGGYTGKWDPVNGATATDYEFTMIELGLDSDGTGEGWASLTTTVVSDDTIETVALSEGGGPPIFEDRA